LAESDYIKTATVASSERGGDPAAPEQTYRHVTGRRGLSGQSIHLGDEFMLCVNSGMFQETYRRFYYRDIQAVLIRRNAAGGATGLALILLALSVIMIAFTLGSMVWVVIGALSVVALIASLSGQGRCVCYIQTPVSIQRLAVTNFRSAKRLLAELSPRIEAVQGPSTPADLHRIMNATPATSEEAASP